MQMDNWALFLVINEIYAASDYFIEVYRFKRRFFFPGEMEKFFSYSRGPNDIAVN